MRQHGGDDFKLFYLSPPLCLDRRWRAEWPTMPLRWRILDGDVFLSSQGTSQQQSKRVLFTQTAAWKNQSLYILDRSPRLPYLWPFPEIFGWNLMKFKRHDCRQSLDLLCFACSVLLLPCEGKVLATQTLVCAMRDLSQRSLNGRFIHADSTITYYNYD